MAGAGARHQSMCSSPGPLVWPTAPRLRGDACVAASASGCQHKCSARPSPTLDRPPVGVSPAHQAAGKVVARHAGGWRCLEQRAHRIVARVTLQCRGGAETTA